MLYFNFTFNNNIAYKKRFFIIWIKIDCTTSLTNDNIDSLITGLETGKWLTRELTLVNKDCLIVRVIKYLFGMYAHIQADDVLQKLQSIIREGNILNTPARDNLDKLLMLFCKMTRRYPTNVLRQKDLFYYAAKNGDTKWIESTLFSEKIASIIDIDKDLMKKAFDFATENKHSVTAAELASYSCIFFSIDLETATL